MCHLSKRRITLALRCAVPDRVAPREQAFQAKTRLSNKIILVHELRPRKAVILAGLHSGVTQAVNVS